MKINPEFEAARCVRIEAEVRANAGAGISEAAIAGTVVHKILEERMAEGQDLITASQSLWAPVETSDGFEDVFDDSEGYSERLFNALYMNKALA